MPQPAPRSRAVLPAFLILVGLVSGFPVGAEEEPRWADADGAQANDLAERGDSEPAVVAAAIADARAAITAAPRDPAGYRAGLIALHAAAILELGNAPGATHEEISAAAAPVVAARHQEAVAIGRSWARALPGEESSLALAELLGGDPEAERVLRQLIEREPRNLAGHEALARWLRAAEREDDVTVLLEALVARDGIPPAAFRLLVDHYENAWLPRSIAETIPRWRKRFPDDRDAIRKHLMLSGAKLDRGEAATLADRLLAVPEPTNEAERDALRQVCWAVRNAQLPERYERCIRRVVAATPEGVSADAVSDLAGFLVDEERWSDLEGLVAGARRVEAAELSRRLASRAAGLARAGRCPAALQVLERSRPHGLATERPLDVAETLTYCVDRERGAAELLAWAEKGGIFGWHSSHRLRQLPPDPAFLAPLVEFLKTRLASAPTDADLNKALEAVLEPFGDVQARVRHLLTWSALAPENATIPMRLARLLLREGEPGEAAVAFADVLARDNGNPEAWNGLVEAQLAAGLDAEAARNAQAAAVADERISSRLMALAAERQQSWRSAADHWARHLALVPQRDLSWQTELPYLLVLKRLGEVEEIEAWLTARAPLASNRDSKSPEAYLGDAWQKLGIPSRARPHYEAALAADPEDADLALGLAQVAGDEGKVKEASALYRRALARDPAQGNRAFAAARYLREHGDAEGALAAIRPAAEKESHGASWLRVELARDLRAAGDADASLALTEQVLAENEHAHLVRLERGEALAALGRDEEALATFHDFLERTAPLAEQRSRCNCNCEVLKARDELLVRLRPPAAGSDATVATAREERP